MLINKLILSVAFITASIFSCFSQQFEWVNHIESSTSQVISWSVTVDSDGAAYIAGYFTGTTDFDPSSGTFNSTAPIQGKAFVAKYSSSGNFVWAKFLDGPSNARSSALTVKVRSNQLFIAGEFGGGVATDFDPGGGMFNLVPVNLDPFILKLDTAGNFIHAVHFNSLVVNSAYQSSIQDMAIAPNGDVVVVGKFQGSMDFDPGTGVDSKVSNGGDDIFVCRLDNNLSFQWAEQFGASGQDWGGGVALDPVGNVHVTGMFANTVDFDPGPSVFNLSGVGADVLVLKLTPQGNFVWAKQLTGSSDDRGQSITVDGLGGVYTVGTFNESLDFDPGSGTALVNAGTYYNAFISKLDANGNYQWGHQIGNGTYSRGFYVTSDIFNNIYLSGDFQGVIDINLGPQTLNFATSGFGLDDDLFLLKLDQNGNHNWAKHIGSVYQSDICWEIAVDAGLNVYSTGQFSGTADFDTGQDTLLLNAQVVGTDSYLHKMGNCTQTYSNISVTSCGAYTLPSGRIEYTTSGVYSDVIDNAQGCDSVITIDLTIASPTSSQIYPVQSNCDYYVSPSGNYTYTESGTYMDTIVNDAGCDSVITINLTSNITFTSITESVCAGFISPSGNEYWTNSGIYYDTLASIVNGCDSIIEIDLTVNTATSSTLNLTACYELTSPSENYVWTTSGTYQDTILNSNNCDSIITINLQILNSSSSQTITTCGGYSSPSGNDYWTVSGIYIDTIQNNNGCDSVITFDLTILPENTTSLTVSSCEVYLSPSGLYAWNSTGVYHDTLTNVNGCDSVIVVDLQILNTSSLQNIESCEGVLSPSGTVYWTNSGTYLDTIPNSNGCDSIITTVLNIDSLTADINMIDNVTLQAVPSGLTYQWVDCLHEMLPISGATQEIFSPQVNGSYAVIVSDGLCSDISDCVEIWDVGVSKLNSEMITRVYPNPTEGIVTIELAQNLGEVQIVVRNVLGDLTFEGNFISSKEIIFECEGPSGVYLIEVVSAEHSDFHRVVKL